MMRLSHTVILEPKIRVVISISILTFLIYHTYLMLPLRCHHNSINDVKTLRENWNRIFSQLKTLRQNHTRLVLRLQDFPGVINESTLQLYTLSSLYLEEKSPTEEYETIRRRIYLGTKELWYYVNHQLRRLFNKTLKLEQRQTIVNEVTERKRWLLIDQERLQTLDGHEEWRRREAASVSDLLQRRLHHLQNPRNCSAAKKLLCYHQIYGFGCRFHHIVYCLVTAYALNRTLIITRHNLKHAFKDWKNSYAIYPLSDTCAETNFHDVPILSAKTYNHSVVYISYLGQFVSKAPVQPYFIPKDLAKRISRFNGDPYSWWIGQMLKYILKLQRPEVISSNIAKINFKSPIVGVHIRRTDKLIIEAEYKDVDEYMSHVEDYYEQLELTQAVDQRRVYLTTDDVDGQVEQLNLPIPGTKITETMQRYFTLDSQKVLLWIAKGESSSWFMHSWYLDLVLKEAIARYPNYTFYGDYINAKMAAEDARFTLRGLTGFFMDLHMLALCDYVVCTFSSNVGRLVYELMQVSRIDAINRVTSVDHMYYFSINEKRLRTAVMRNKNISLNINDLIEHLCVHDNVTGTVLRTKESGRIPWHKTEEHIIQFPYPEYKELPLFNDNIANTNKKMIKIISEKR